MACSGEESPCAQASPSYTCARVTESQPASEARISVRDTEKYPDELTTARSEENIVPARFHDAQRQT